MADAKGKELFEKMGLMVGGKWIGEPRDEAGLPRIEWSYEWSADRRVLRGTGTIYGASCESRLGWDPAEEKVYYLDMHGSETVYFGYMVLDGEEIVSDFEAIVGPPGLFRSRGRFTSRDHYLAMIQSVEDGIATDMHAIRLTRMK